MKKNKSIIIVFGILLILAVLLIISRSTSTYSKKIMEFAVEDTASITKIFLSDKKNNNVLLERKNNAWVLNKNKEANNEVVKILLNTIKNMQVSSPVSLASRDNVISRMSVLSTKVEVYQNVYRINLFDKIKLFKHEKLTNTFYVGDDTQNNMGTYMLKEGASEPFIVSLPSLRGFLSTRFMATEDTWRKHIVFNLMLKDIKSVKMLLPDYPDSSFVINKTENLVYSFMPLKDNKPIPYDTIKMLKFLSSFDDIRYETYLNNIYEKRKVDSIIASKPTHILSVTDNMNNTYTIKTFKKKPQYGNYIDEVTGALVIWDRDRLYGLINEDKDLILIQYYVFDKILKTVDNFRVK